jgi:signal transduction histidine kinase
LAKDDHSSEAQGQSAAASAEAPGAAPGLVTTWDRLVALSRRPRQHFDKFGLSAKLLALTVFFVMLAEVLIFVPSIANYRTQWIGDRLSAARIAALAAEAVPSGEVPETIAGQLLEAAQVRMVAIKRDDQRRLVLSAPLERPIERTYDLRPMLSKGGATPWSWLTTRLELIRDALVVFFDDDDRHVAFLGQVNASKGDFIEIVVPVEPLKDAMVRHGLNILGLSILISGLAGGLVYLALNSMFVQPLTRLTRNMVAFSSSPEDSSRIIQPTGRGDEIGTAERELAKMQGELSQMLAQKNRLAALGLAVSKINHDMRNMLASVQLISDNLTSVKDPRVQRFAPKLMASLDRAINFCNDTLRFGRVAEATPRRDLITLRLLIDEVGDGLGLPRKSGVPAIDWRIEVGEGLRVDADRDQLFRVLSNLVRNSVQAIESQQPARAGSISVLAGRDGRRVWIDIKDDGPGLPAIAKAHLFEAFQGSTRRGGSGLGLAIAFELVAAHGGRIELVEPVGGIAAQGTHFRLTLPDRSVQA